MVNKTTKNKQNKTHKKRRQLNNKKHTLVKPTIKGLGIYKLKSVSQDTAKTALLLSQLRNFKENNFTLIIDGPVLSNHGYNLKIPNNIY